MLSLGKFGTLVGMLLKKTGCKVFGADLHAKAGLLFETKELDVTDITQVAEMMQEYDAIVSCLPYNFTLEIATRACRHGIHDFDLTEDVPTTKEIIQVSESAHSILAPQCGLAYWEVGTAAGPSVAKSLLKVIPSPCIKLARMN